MVCAVIGDSIAYGFHQLAVPQCNVEALSGINSGAYTEQYSTLWNNDFTIIPPGTNDRDSNIADNIRILRKRISRKCVVWLLPNNHPKQRVAIKRVTAGFRDRLVDTAPFVGPDNLHPVKEGYDAIVPKVMKGSRMEN